MDRPIILSLLTAALLGTLGFFLLMPPDRDEGEPRLPWRVTRTPSGHLRVFGFTLGETTLAQVQAVFQEKGKLNLFARLDPSGQPEAYSAEAYFDRIYLNHLRGDFIFTLAVEEDRLASLYERGLRISQLSSGAKRVTLPPEDRAALADRPIASLTYLPWKSLTPDILQRRFGSPQEKRLEPKTRVIHWLYPQKGMDLAIDPRGGVVIQYLNPEAFEAVLAPLQRLPKLEETSEGSPRAD